MNADGSCRKTAYAAKSGSVFSTSWAHEGNLIAFAEGETFGGPESRVDIATLRPDGTGYYRLTADVGNNGFPSFSPDGQWLVFRSGRGGSKNLYIMHPDGTGVRQLTKGKWSDTMADWSPTGDWI